MSVNNPDIYPDENKSGQHGAMAVQALTGTQRFSSNKKQRWMFKRLPRQLDIPQNGANPSKLAEAFPVPVINVVAMVSYLLCTNKGSGERLTLVSVLWTSSLQEGRWGRWKIRQRRCKTGAPGKIRSCCILPGLTRSTKLTPPGGNTGN